MLNFSVAPNLNSKEHKAFDRISKRSITSIRTYDTEYLLLEGEVLIRVYYPGTMTKSERKRLCQQFSLAKRWSYINDLGVSADCEFKLITGVDPKLVISHGAQRAIKLANASKLSNQSPDVKTNPKDSKSNPIPRGELKGEDNDSTWFDEETSLIQEIIGGLRQKKVIVPVTIGLVTYLVYCKTRPSSTAPSKGEVIFYPLGGSEESNSSKESSGSLENRVGNSNQYSNINWRFLPSLDDLDAVCERYTSFANGDKSKIARVTRWRELAEEQLKQNDDAWNKIQGHRDPQKEFNDLLSKNNF